MSVYADPMLLLMDLDNTLVDRDGAFAAWAERHIQDIGGDESDLRWLIAADESGYAKRAALADGLIGRCGLDASRDQVITDLRHGHVPAIRCYDGILDALQERRTAGDTLVILTNGWEDQQTAKIHYAGLEGVADRVVISETIGAKKPAPEIFAAAIGDQFPADPPWMIGDHAENDIVGGQRAGCRTGWVAHGRVWGDGAAPTVTAETTVEVLERMNASISTHSRRGEDGSLADDGPPRHECVQF